MVGRLQGVEVHAAGHELVAPVPEIPGRLTAAGTEFIIKADDDTSYRIVDQVIDALKQAKVQTIYLLSQQETVGG